MRYGYFNKTQDGFHTNFLTYQIFSLQKSYSGAEILLYTENQLDST